MTAPSIFDALKSLSLPGLAVILARNVYNTDTVAPIAHELAEWVRIANIQPQ